MSATEADELLAAATDPRPAAAQRLLAEERRRLLREVLDALPDDAREAVTLYYREGSSVARVAVLLDLSEAAVRKRLSRARANLRSALEERFAEAAGASAPGPAFTAGVMAAVAVAAPVTASAATAGAASLAGQSTLVKLAAAAGGLLMGACGGILGIVLGLRSLRCRPFDPRERRDLDRFALAAVAWVLAATAGFAVSWELSGGSPWSQVATFAVFLAGLAALYQLWLPRILRRRHERERLEDPERARSARLRERRWAAVGWTVGILSGTAGLIAGLMLG